MITPESVYRYVGTLRTARDSFPCVLYVIDIPSAFGQAYDWHAEISGDVPPPAFVVPADDAAPTPVTLHMECGCVFTAEAKAHNLTESAGSWFCCLASSSPLNDTPIRCQP